MSGIHCGQVRRDREKIIETFRLWREAYGTAPNPMVSAEFIELLKKGDKTKERTQGDYAALPSLLKITSHTRFEFSEGLGLPVINPTSDTLASASDPAALVLGLGATTATAANGGAGALVIAGGRAEQVRPVRSLGMRDLPTYTGYIRRMHVAAQEYNKSIQTKSFKDYFSAITGGDASDRELSKPSEGPEFLSHRDVMASGPIAMLKNLMASNLTQEEQIIGIDAVIKIMNAWSASDNLMWPNFTFNRRVPGIQPGNLGAYVRTITKDLFANYKKILKEIRAELSKKSFIDLSKYTSRVSNRMHGVYEDGLKYLYQLMYFHRVPDHLLNLCEVLKDRITNIDCDPRELLLKFLREPELLELIATILTDELYQEFSITPKIDVFLEAHRDQWPEWAERFKTFYRVFTASDILIAQRVLAEEFLSPGVSVESVKLRRSKEILVKVGAYELPRALDFRHTDVLSTPLRFSFSDVISEVEAKRQFEQELKDLLACLRKFLLLYFATRENAEFTAIFNAASEFINGHLKAEHYGALLELIAQIKTGLKSFEEQASHMKDAALASLRSFGGETATDLSPKEALRFANNMIDALDVGFPESFDLLTHDIKKIKEVVSTQEMARLLGICRKDTQMHHALLECAVGRALPPPNNRVIRDAAEHSARLAITERRVQKSLGEYASFSSSLLFALPAERAKHYAHHQASVAAREREEPRLVPEGYIDMVGFMGAQEFTRTALLATGLSDVMVAGILRAQFETVKRSIESGELRLLSAIESQRLLDTRRSRVSSSALVLGSSSDSDEEDLRGRGMAVAVASSDFGVK